MESSQSKEVDIILDWLKFCVGEDYKVVGLNLLPVLLAKYDQKWNIIVPK